MKKQIFLVLIITLFSCKQTIYDKDINKLIGYWEIEKVVLANGENKYYKVNETIDYFMIKNNKGFRQKVMPQFDGKFKTNDENETIFISKNENRFYINYETNFGKWKEEIIAINDSTLILKSKNNSEYYYKKFKPFSLK